MRESRRTSLDRRCPLEPKDLAGLVRPFPCELAKWADRGGSLQARRLEVQADAFAVRCVLYVEVLGRKHLPIAIDGVRR